MREPCDRDDPKVAVKPPLRADESGMALIYITAMLPVIVGFALLAIDASRAYILNSSLQHGADAIALAMAAELDRTADAITRAERAKDNLVSNPAVFTGSYSAVNGSTVSWRFLNALPASDRDAIPDNPYKTTSPTAARYVEVTVTPAQFDSVFPASFISAVGSFSTTATAIAGMDPGACNVVPMFICNPIEPAGNTDPYRTTELMNHINTASERRKLIEMKVFANSGGQAQFSPGNFGYVETPLGNGARALGDAISQAVPGACISLSSLQTKPGNTAAANAAFNVRFDMYGGQYKKNDSSIRPARNTRKSYTAGNGANGACNESPITDLYTNTSYLTTPPANGMGFPRDACQVLDNCGTGFGGRIGGGDWNGMFNMYMQSNFGADPALWPKKNAGTGTPFSSSDLPSRYEVYRAEIDQGFVSATASTRLKGMAYPACYTGATAPSDLPDRRLIFAAIANCRAQPVGSGSTTIKAAAFGLFFLSEPVGSQGSVYAELVDVVKPGSGSGSNGALVVDNVQLYR